jgi:hypothetical protein
MSHGHRELPRGYGDRVRAERAGWTWEQRAIVAALVFLPIGVLALAFSLPVAAVALFGCLLLMRLVGVFGPP